MLKKRSVYTRYAADIFTVMEQARQEGKEISGFIDQAKFIAGMHIDNPEREVMAAKLLDSGTNSSWTSTDCPLVYGIVFRLVTYLCLFGTFIGNN